ncbi:MAG: hypothetical protein OXB94_10580 [Nitrospira sp.]|nr:hypothetical protein [Nitrospira sp.]
MTENVTAYAALLAYTVNPNNKDRDGVFVSSLPRTRPKSKRLGVS